jgi:CheY-like chemotaxis protein
MGGWIEVESALDQGSTFTVTLPLRSTMARPCLNEDKPDAVAHTGTQLAPPGGFLVLVAEDNTINQKVIGHQLALLGISAEMVGDGIDALASWRAGRDTHRHALLLTDLHMPGMDGYTLATTIRSEEISGSHLPIIALSANALQGELDRCLSAGMDDYLSKPVQIDQLGKTIKYWLRDDHAHALVTPDSAQGAPLGVFEGESSLRDYDDKALGMLVGDDPALLADFRQRFVLSAISTMDEMRTAAQIGEFKALSNLAHRLKSSARAVGAVSLGTCCERIERAYPACDAVQIHGHMAQMEEALAHAMTCLSDEVGFASLASVT